LKTFSNFVAIASINENYSTRLLISLRTSSLIYPNVIHSFNISMDSSSLSLYSLIKISKMFRLVAFSELFTAISNAHLTIIPRLSLETYKKVFFNSLIIRSIINAISKDFRNHEEILDLFFLDLQLMFYLIFAFFLISLELQKCMFYTFKRITQRMNQSLNVLHGLLFSLHVVIFLQ